MGIPATPWVAFNAVTVRGSSVEFCHSTASGSSESVERNVCGH